MLHLRPTRPSDLPALFEMQSDPESNLMAGTKPRTREVFFATWQSHFANPRINGQVIELETQRDGAYPPRRPPHAPESPLALAPHRQVVGSIACFQAPLESDPSRVHDCIGYWIARPHWGKSIASRALALFLTYEPRRPLHATTARTNLPSQHILLKCGFRCTGFRMGEETERYLAREVAEFVLE